MKIRLLAIFGSVGIGLLSSSCRSIDKVGKEISDEFLNSNDFSLDTGWENGFRRLRISIIYSGDRSINLLFTENFFEGMLYFVQDGRVPARILDPAFESYLVNSMGGKVLEIDPGWSQDYFLDSKHLAIKLKSLGFSFDEDIIFFADWRIDGVASQATKMEDLKQYEVLAENPEN